MHALIDLDILCYEMGNAKDPDTGFPLSWPLVQWRVDERIQGILEATEAESWQGYLTGSGNFRDMVGTIRPYKGTRDRSERPFWYEGVYRYLERDRGATVIHGMEADDGISIDSGDDTIICSRDKDLLQVPGWHYIWPGYEQQERPPFYVSDLEGLRFFYSQLLTGDTADNIPGLYNVGPKSACVARVNQADNELDMFKEVKEQYELRFGSYWDMFMCENGQLLWLLRSKDDNWYVRQKELSARLGS